MTGVTSGAGTDYPSRAPETINGIFLICLPHICGYIEDIDNWLKQFEVLHITYPSHCNRLLYLAFVISDIGEKLSAGFVQ